MAVKSGISSIFASDIETVTPAFNAAASGRAAPDRTLKADLTPKPPLDHNPRAAEVFSRAAPRPANTDQRPVVSSSDLLGIPRIRAQRLANDRGPQ